MTNVLRMAPEQRASYVSRQLNRQAVETLRRIHRIGGDATLDKACRDLALTALTILKSERGYAQLLYALDFIEAAV